MKALFLTNEYPPQIYGGAGVHVEYLGRELAKLMPLEVRCFGEADATVVNPAAQGFPLDASGFSAPKALHSVLGALQRCNAMASVATDAQVVHCHTWYAHWGGIVLKQCLGIPLVVTVHSLEPLRPWKREQLGGGYDFTCWLEKTALEMADAVVCVSNETLVDVKRLFNIREDRLHVIYNGIDLVEYECVDRPGVLKKYGVNPARPYVLFVGRITRQKGIIHLVRAIRHMNPGFQVVLCAGAPDTPEIEAEMKVAVAEAQELREGVFWICGMLSTEEKIALYSHAAVFCCPSIYEPFGIINLEAMACKVPVVASGVGGIKEVVVDGETGFLVGLEQMKESPFEALNPDQFAHDLAEKINVLMADPALCKRMGEAGRKRAESIFGWDAIARQTAALYEQVLYRRSMTVAD